MDLKERIDLLQKPYIKASEVAKICGCSPSTVSRRLKEHGARKGGRWGWLTEDVIKAFDLDGFLKRNKKSLSVRQANK